MSNYIVFLDMDGVFATSRVHMVANTAYLMWHKLDPVAVDLMNCLHDKFDVEFVLSSTWRLSLDAAHVNQLHWVFAAFGAAGFRGMFAREYRTGQSNHAFKSRALEIKEYLETYAEIHPEFEDFLIFDDDDFSFDEVLGKKRFVKTDPADGILSKHIQKTFSITGQWKQKTNREF